jgi:hypothetical protein
MMIMGRCAGCGEKGNAHLLREHIRYCQDYARLHAGHPEQALAPEEEFVRWKKDQRSGERAGRREAAIDEADRRRAVQADRWATPPDIVED